VVTKVTTPLNVPSDSIDTIFWRTGNFRKFWEIQPPDAGNSVVKERAILLSQFIGSLLRVQS
jgi:hypothetical protein